MCPLTSTKLKAVQIESRHTIDMGKRVRSARKEIDKRYLDKPYYIAPARQGCGGGFCRGSATL